MSKPPSKPTWPSTTELVGVTFSLRPDRITDLPLNYTFDFHGWFLDQVRQTDPKLSAILHDAQTEKSFTLSGLAGPLPQSGRRLQLQKSIYKWTLTALSTPLVQWLKTWLDPLPSSIPLRLTPFTIQDVEFNPAPTTYKKLWQTEYPDKNLKLSFSSPTSFRRHGEHLPLPWPRNLFHSYLRRWNLFSHTPFDPDPFLDWIDASVLIDRHQLQSTKVPAGKSGIVTGFQGAIELKLTRTAATHPTYPHLFRVLGHFAPYCGTGHKTTFGLGQTRLGWTSLQSEPAASSAQMQLCERIEHLTQTFIEQRQRKGGKRAQKTAETWATILARREFGESLQDIAQDLDMLYETVKTYAKLARRSLKDNT